MAKGKARMGGRAPLHARGAFLRDIGRADTRLRAARALIVDRLGDGDAASSPMPLEYVTDVRAAAAHVADVAVEVATLAIAMPAAARSTATIRCTCVARRGDRDATRPHERRELRNLGRGDLGTWRLVGPTQAPPLRIAHPRKTAIVAAVPTKSGPRPRSPYTPPATIPTVPATATPTAPSNPCPAATCSGGLDIATATWLAGIVNESAIVWTTDTMSNGHNGRKP